MTKLVEKRRIHCPRRHLEAFVIGWDDGRFTVRCSLLKQCGDLCPYLKDPNYVSPFKRAPGYEPK